VLNRLAERGLLSRQKAGNAIEYRPVVSETEYRERSAQRTGGRKVPLTLMLSTAAAAGGAGSDVRGTATPSADGRRGSDTL
jgi:hypothetical protein